MSSTVPVELKHVYRDRDRHGNVRVYFWRGKGHRKVRLRAEPGTPEFAAEYQDALEGRMEPPAPAERPTAPARAAAGSYRWLCQQYIASGEFLSLNASTRRARRGILESTWDEETRPGSGLLFADVPAGRITPQAVRVLRDRKAAAPEAANGRVKALRQVFRWAMKPDVALAADNPAAIVAYLRPKNPEGFHTWTLAEVEAFQTRHPAGTKAGLALALLMFTGVRRSDVVRLGRQMMRDGWLRFTEVKGHGRTPKLRELPVLPELQAAIEATPAGNLTFLTTEFGAPFTAAGFGNWFRRRCNEAGLPQCSAHGLRKAGATVAAENGATDRQLMAIFGWTSEKQATVYTRAANRKRLAAAAMDLLVPRTDGERILSHRTPEALSHQSQDIENKAKK